MDLYSEKFVKNVDHFRRKLHRYTHCNTTTCAERLKFSRISLMLVLCKCRAGSMLAPSAAPPFCTPPDVRTKGLIKNKYRKCNYQ